MSNNIPYVLYENNNFILLYKPPFWSCSSNIKILEKFKEYPEKNKFIILFIKFILKNNYSKSKFPSGLMNRLDLETSGCVFVVKNKIGFNKIFKLIHSKKEITKIYLCLTNNTNNNNMNLINKPINCDTEKSNYHVKSQCFITNSINKKYTATSVFYKISTLYDDENNEYTLFFVRIFTGKTHQIRVHMKSIGCPLVSDPQYIDKELYKRNKKLINRCFLHNIYYQFRYDNIDKKIFIPLPNDILSCLKKLKSSKNYNINKIPNKLLNINKKNIKSLNKKDKIIKTDKIIKKNNELQNIYFKFL